MMNKKGSGVVTDSGVILAVLVFQAIIILGLGFISINPDSQNVNGGIVSDFSVNIINNVTVLGWGNAVIFTPLIIVIIYIVAKLIRGGG